MSLMSNVKTGSSDAPAIEEDRTGGDYTLATGLHELVVEAAYLKKSGSSDALALVLKLKNREKKTFEEQIWFTNRNQETFYVKDGQQNNLPGFNQVNSISTVLVDKNFLDLDTEKKQIMIWDRNESKEMPTEVDMVTALINQKFIGGVQHIYENLRKEVNGEWVADTDYSRQYNHLDKVFHVDSRKTAGEIINNKEATFIEKWANQNTETIDKTVGGIGLKPRPRNEQPAQSNGGGTQSAKASTTEKLF